MSRVPAQKVEFLRLHCAPGCIAADALLTVNQRTQRNAQTSTTGPATSLHGRMHAWGSGHRHGRSWRPCWDPLVRWLGCASYGRQLFCSEPFMSFFFNFNVHKFDSNLRVDRVHLGAPLAHSHTGLATTSGLSVLSPPLPAPRAGSGRSFKPFAMGVVQVEDKLTMVNKKGKKKSSHKQRAKGARRPG